MKNEVLNDFNKVFTIIPDSHTKIKSSLYQESGKYAVVDQGKDLIAGYTNTSPTVDEVSLPVIVFGDHTRAVKYIDFAFAAGADGTQILKPSPMTNPKYAYYLVLHAVSKIPSKGYARHFGELKKMLFSIPPKEEQRKIVEKLDLTFEEIDLLEKNLQLSEGKLDQLFQSLISDSFPRPHEVKMTPLKELCTLFNDGDWIETKDQSDDGIRLIQTGNVGSGSFKDRIEKARWISEETFLRLRCTEVKEGDVLISRLPDPVGRACLIPVLEHKAITAVDCTIIRFDLEKIRSKYFVYFSQSSKYASAIEPLISGATRQRISREKLGTIQIPVPHLDDQDEIVKKLDSVSGEISALKLLLETKKLSANSLRQSLLSAAFGQDVGRS